MVEHIVLFKLKPGTTEAEKAKLLRLARGLKTTIPGIVDLQVGETFIPERGQGFTIALVVRFEDRDALAVYGPHPNHAPVKDYASEVCESLLAIDFDL